MNENAETARNEIAADEAGRRVAHGLAAALAETARLLARTSAETGEAFAEIAGASPQAGGMKDGGGALRFAAAFQNNDRVLQRLEVLENAARLVAEGAGFDRLRAGLVEAGPLTELAALFAAALDGRALPALDAAAPAAPDEDDDVLF